MTEWYDFGLYLYFSKQIGQYFFSNLNPLSAQMMAYFTFFLGALIRPLGGFCIGWLSDHYNPHTIVKLCIIAMGFATCMVAALPSPDRIGMASPLLLMCLRLIQGLSVGGQFPALIAMAVNDHDNDKSFFISIMLSISTAGFLLASLSSVISCHYFSWSHSTWAWRAPFLASALLLTIFLYIHPSETPTQATPEITKQRPNLLSALKHQYLAIIAISLLTIMGSSMFYIVLGYLVSHAIHQWHVPRIMAQTVNMLGLISACVLYPIMGRFCDHFNAHKAFYTAAIILIATIAPMMMAMRYGSLTTMSLSMVLLVVLMATLQGAMSPHFAAVFAPEWRATCCAISYNIGNAASGAAPMLALMTADALPHMGIAVFLMALTCLGLIGYSMVLYRTPHPIGAPGRCNHIG